MPAAKILLVDDVDFFLAMEKDYLRQTPAEILVANNGLTALAAAEQHRPNLIFMDVNMPVMDGLAACRKLKEDRELRQIPVVMVFAPSADVDEAACLAAGCDAVIKKPVDRNLFLQTGHRFLFAVERRQPRVSCQMTVDFHHHGGVVSQGMGVNISASGMYIGSRQPVKPDDRLGIGFFLPAISAERIELNVRIAWVNQGFPRSHMQLPQGFGVAFANVPPNCAAIIGEFLQRFGES